MNTVIRRPDPRRSGPDPKTFDFALKLCDAIFQPEHVVAARIVHGQGLGPVTQALPKALGHRCALLCLIGTDHSVATITLASSDGFSTAEKWPVFFSVTICAAGISDRVRSRSSVRDQSLSP